MKKMLMTVVALVAAVTIADELAETNAVNTAKKKNMREAIYRATGGMVKDTRAQKGKVVYVNCQQRAKAEWLTEQAKVYSDDLKIAVEVANGVFAFPTPELQGDASIFIVDDPKLPMSLIALESKWAMVNVAPLMTEKEAFAKARVQKEIGRCFAHLCGATGSQFPMAVVEPVTAAEQLDVFPIYRLPYDLLMRMNGYLPKIGIVPYKMASYRKACQEGWAQMPTNEVQQAVWKKVHEMPTSPIKILPKSQQKK